MITKKLLLIALIFQNALFPKKYIITGGECVGKSTVINLLKERGYQIVPEGFGQLYHELMDTEGFQELWSDLLTRERLLINRKVANEQAVDPESIAFLDRCALESVFYADLQHTPIEPDLIELAQSQVYENIVFMLDFLPEEYYEQKGWRIQTREVACATHEYLGKRYKDHGFTVIHVPFGTPEERVDFILEQLQASN